MDKLHAQIVDMILDEVSYRGIRNLQKIYPHIINSWVGRQASIYGKGWELYENNHTLETLRRQHAKNIKQHKAIIDQLRRYNNRLQTHRRDRSRNNYSSCAIL